MTRYHDDRRLGALFEKGLQDLDAIHARHFDVEDDEIRVLLQSQVDPERPVGRHDGLVAFVA